MTAEEKYAKTAMWISLIAVIVSILTLLKPGPLQTWLDNRASAFVANESDRPINPRTVQVQTSGYRLDKDGDRWEGSNLIDGKAETAWSECAVRDPEGTKKEARNPCEEPADTGADIATRCDQPERFAADDVVQGVGEYAELKLPSETDLKAVYIQNGYQKNDQLFVRNPRVAVLRVEADGKFVKDLELKDEKAPQRFELETSGTTIRFTIEKTYLGMCIPSNGVRGRLGYFYDASLGEITLIPEKVPSSG
jgi:hypothetical protein